MSENRFIDYTELKVWLKSRELVGEIYNLTRVFPEDEKFGIISQMRRSAVSVPSNIAEGCGRRTKKDSNQFFYISRGSLFELETQLYLSFDQGYINSEALDSVLQKAEECKKLLNGFINYNKKDVKFQT